jgi:hypothetical protein
MNARLADLERVRDDFETDRGLLERKISTLEIERNELGRSIRFNSETCHRALERVLADGEKELAEWLATMRTEDTPRPPNGVVIARYLFETTDFGDWLTAKLDEAIAADTEKETFDPRSTKELEKLRSDLDVEIAEKRAELKLREEACLAAGGAVRAAERGDNGMVERFLAEYGAAAQ